LAEPSVHIVTGGTGAGKTTYARALATRVGGVRFSIDDWMTTLFWMDSPQPIKFAWTMARIERCESLIRSEITALSAIGVATVLDLGFTRADHRNAFAAFAAALGATTCLHFVDVSSEERWRRVESRNAARGETYAMQVDRAMFDFMESAWQAPSADELRALNGFVVT
jgi:predicted kinase